MIECAVVFDTNGVPLSWHQGISPVEIADSRFMWHLLWEHRKTVGGVAHTHPGHVGQPAPSYTDLTTFSAIERGLGRRLLWPIANETTVLYWGSERADFDIRFVDRPAWGEVLLDLRGCSWNRHD